MFRKCNLETLENGDYVYRGTDRKEALEVIRKGYAISLEPISLIANDYEVLEYAYEETRDMSEKEREKYLKNIIPEWATKEGCNFTTDFSNALGYAESRNGIVLVFDIGNITEEEIFRPSSVHIQVKNPSKVKLIGYYDLKENKSLSGFRFS